MANNAKNKPWSESELEALNSAGTHVEVALEIGRTRKSVELKRAELRAQGKLKPRVESTSVAEDREREASGFWQRQYAALDGKYKKALREANATEVLVASARELAPVGYEAAPAILRGTKASTGHPQSAVLMFSDTHVGKEVKPDQTLGFGHYNFNIFLARLKFLEESVASIVCGHTTTKIDELVIVMLGDMLDGALSHGVEAGQVNTLFSQFYGAGHAIAQFLRNLARLGIKIKVQTVVGNHPRWQNQKRMPTENRFSNLDMFLYAYVEALTCKIENISWDLNQQPFSIFKVQGFTFHASHGDHWRGGDKALGIPNHAIGRSISTTAQLFGKAGESAPDYFLAGHLHRSISIPHARGDVLINGGFPGLDNYALAESFNPVDPTQRFFMVHPKYGKTASYEISLKFAKMTPTQPYDLPGGFPVT